MIRLSLAGIVLATFLLQGCSSSSQTVRIPTELQPIATTQPLSLQWQLSVDRLAEADGRSLRIAADDAHIYVAASSGLVSALLKKNQSRYSDQVVWQLKLDAAVLAGPVINHNQLLIGTAKGDVISLDAKTGVVNWLTHLNSEIVSKPVIAQQRVLVRTNDGRVVALNLANGAEVWTADHQMPNLFLRGAAPVVVDGEQVYIGRESGYVEALSLHSGEKLWEARVAIPSGRTDLERMVDVQASLVLDSGRLFVLSYNGRMAAINPANGNFLWTKELSGYRDMVVLDKVIYLMDEDDILRALDPTTGTEYWNQQGLKYRMVGDIYIDRLVSTEPQLLVTDGLGYLHWIDPKSGGFNARFKHADHLDFGRQILQLRQDQDRYYLLDSDGRVTSYRFQPSAKTTRPGRSAPLSSHP